MARSRRVRLISLILANVLLPVALLVFAAGFFPFKPLLPGLATFEDVQERETWGGEQPEAVFDRVIFMVVDALRSDFVYGYDSGFEFTQRYVLLTKADVRCESRLIRMPALYAPAPPSRSLRMRLRLQ